MVLISDKKYACEACIKGHRSSTCKHTDRPLFEIKKKGRPVTQCEHCRELRKTKQVHVKCLCEAKDAAPNNDPPAARKKGNLKKVLASAAYPDGLPEALGASVAPRASSDASSDSEHGVRARSEKSCNCKYGGDCHCFIMKHTPRPRGHSTSSASALTGKSLQSGTLGLRPVLPRPPRQSPPATSEHTRLQAPHPQTYRPTHASSFFSPYGRAYEEHYQPPQAQYREGTTKDSAMSSPQPMSDQSTTYPSVAQADIALPAALLDKMPPQGWSDFDAMNTDLKIFCGCGDGCSCSGCVQHRGPAAWFNRDAGCVNPTACNTCLTCSLPSVAPPPAPTPPTTPFSGIPSQFEPLDDWIRSIPTLAPAENNYQPGQADIMGYSVYGYPDVFLPDIIEPEQSVMDVIPTGPGRECCGGRCQCPSGQGQCSTNNCGSRSGCQRCDHRFHGAHGQVTYAVSGERTPCCGGTSGPDEDRTSQGSGSTYARLAPPPSTESRSRASSTSSRSSQVSSIASIPGEVQLPPGPIHSKVSSSAGSLSHVFFDPSQSMLYASPFSRWSLEQQEYAYDSVPTPRMTMF
ncbi:hypothetical protein BV25DRAFT_801327 [Artomyces pyxidatus]|uniref:Uncharacterized protein n=1 Tax=Artomyces pyxidatus TaxID=48021 RepID=A0ACB8SZ92_9AGAM|nr:hypothetical protein BV25DRAFT_801327 [Artomyces pyxidatus]